MRAIFAWSGELHIWNNSLYNSGDTNVNYATIFLFGTGGRPPGGVTIYNNIIHTRPNGYYLYVQSGAEAPLVDSNCYWGGNVNTIPLDSHKVVVAPKYVNPPYDLSLQDTSPCISVGSSAVSTVVQKDHNGVLRPQGSGYDIGAYEYVSGTIIYGDVSGNGEITAYDAALIAQYAMGLIDKFPIEE